MLDDIRRWPEPVPRVERHRIRLDSGRIGGHVVIQRNVSAVDCGEANLGFIDDTRRQLATVEHGRFSHQQRGVDRWVENIGSIDVLSQPMPNGQRRGTLIQGVEDVRMESRMRRLPDIPNVQQEIVVRRSNASRQRGLGAKTITPLDYPTFYENRVDGVLKPGRVNTQIRTANPGGTQVPLSREIPCQSTDRGRRGDIAVQRHEETGWNYDAPRGQVRSSRRRETNSSSEVETDEQSCRRRRRRSRVSTPVEKNFDSKKEIRPNRYSGRSCVETFITQFRICATHNKWSEAEKTAQLKCSLIEDAGQLIWDSGRPDEITYEELMEKLRRRYGSVDQHEKYKAQLRARRRSPGESLARVYQDIRGLMTRAYPGQATSDMGEQMALDHFLSALNDKHLELKIRERFPSSLDEAFKQAVQLEASQETVDSRQGREERGHGRGHKDEGLARRVSQLEQHTTNGSIEPSKMAELRHQMTEMSKELGRLKALQPQSNQRRDPNYVQTPPIVQAISEDTGTPKD